MRQLLRRRDNGTIELPDNIILQSDLSAAIQSKIIIISVNSQGLRSLMAELKGYGITQKTFVLCMKGIEIGTGKRLSEIVRENISDTNTVAVWLGPGHIQEFYRGVPNCMVIDSDDERIKEQLVTSFSSELIRFYLGNDLTGNEIGAAAKNVIGIAAGMLDGFGLSSLKGALMARGPREISRLIVAMGGNELSAYGLCHLGDYEATVFSQYSHNRQYGENLIKGKEYSDLAEGYYTAKALMDLAQEYKVDLPICSAVYDVMYNGRDAKKTLNDLFLTSIKKEF